MSYCMGTWLLILVNFLWLRVEALYIYSYFPHEKLGIIKWYVFCAYVTFSLNNFLDGGVTLGMVLLCEAATSDMDIGKRKSKPLYATV